jgi:hypothetical protein
MIHLGSGVGGEMENTYSNSASPDRENSKGELR